jgi:di/tricarboxylate transporter
MTFDQAALFALLGGVFGFLLWGKIRYDVVAFLALVVALLIGVVPKTEAFSGLGHPATVIIALVLVVSRGLFSSGAIELLSRLMVDSTRGLSTHISFMAGLGAVLSGIMNNVAALALLMPIDIQAAKRAKRSAALSLMPLSFATILGGMVTLIGTPPNIVVATIREESLGEGFSMFDFAPVGGIAALVGIAFVALVGWRLLPKRVSEVDTSSELEHLQDYVAEGNVPAESKLIGLQVRELYSQADDNDVSIIGLVRDGRRMLGSARNHAIRADDLLVLEGAPGNIEQFIGAIGLELPSAERSDPPSDLLGSGTLSLIEVVVPDGALIAGHSALDLQLAYRQGVMLLGVSRQGQRFRERVRKLQVQPGDILLLYGPEDRLPEVTNWLGCIPLAERGLQVIQREKAGLATVIFAVAIALASFGFLYLPVALALTVCLYVLLGVVPLSRLYTSVEWPVIVLLGSLIPIGSALESSGGTKLIADWILLATQGMSAVAVLTILMIVTMTLSDVLNNVATALIAAPIGIDIAGRLDVSPDPFLMAVAVAASCAFLTPIGHKNNTIIMGPGGYRFGDYWRMGLPLEILIVVISIPTILWVWPL